MKRIDATNLAKEKLFQKENPKAEAEWLVALSLGIKRSEVYENKELSHIEEKCFLNALDKRLKGMPLAYIFNSQEFYGYTFFVDSSVLIPRPETEELVLWALEYISGDMSVLDVGTGSGAIAVAIKKQSNARVVAVDVSEKVLKVAKRNALKNNAEIEFVKSNLFDGLSGRKFDVIISNPPYVSDEEYEGLEEEVKNFEPKVALCGGKDGLNFYREITAKAPAYLNENGLIFFEIGYKQAQSVKKLLERNFCDIEIKKDLEGQDRMIMARLKENRNV